MPNIRQKKKLPIRQFGVKRGRSIINVMKPRINPWLKDASNDHNGKILATKAIERVRDTKNAIIIEKIIVLSLWKSSISITDLTDKNANTTVIQYLSKWYCICRSGRIDYNDDTLIDTMPCYQNMSKWLEFVNLK